jgi:hypothetical protein
MFEYEVYVLGIDGAFYTFSDNWRYEKGERIFVEKDGVIYSVIINTITHNLLGKPIVRLNCQAKEYKKQ